MRRHLALSRRHAKTAVDARNALVYFLQHSESPPSLIQRLDRRPESSIRTRTLFQKPCHPRHPGCILMAASSSQ